MHCRTSVAVSAGLLIAVVELSLVSVNKGWLRAHSREPFGELDNRAQCGNDSANSPVSGELGPRTEQRTLPVNPPALTLAPHAPSTVEYRVLTLHEMGLTDEAARNAFTGQIGRELPGRTIPDEVTLDELEHGGWTQKVVPLPEANTLDNWHYQQRLFGVVNEGSADRRFFVPQVILLKLRDREVLAALRVPQKQELEAIRILQEQANVEYAGLNSLERRMFWPDDTELKRQWHHDRMGSATAWDVTTGNGSVRVAIVDAAFQMDHPDLAANVAPGWDVWGNVAVTNSRGADHSTGAAGLVAAVINNGVGVAGAVNCTILPIQINGTLAEMYLGTLWAGSNGVRVVNISWTGADDPIMNYAGMWLQDHARGILAMVGGNDAVRFDYTNYPAVIAISGTSATDQMPFGYGPHIDFAAPGVGVYTTAVSSGYASRSGTSYATPLFSGIVAAIMMINPALNPQEVIEILKATATDLGPPGWDEQYGWGLIDYAKAARMAAATLRIVEARPAAGGFAVTMNYWQSADYALQRSAQPGAGDWKIVPNTKLSVDSAAAWIRLTDPTPASNQGYYRVVVTIR